MYERGCRVFVELGPKPTLLGMAKDCVTDSEVLWLPSLREGRDDSRQILDSLAALYVAGAPVDWAAFHDARPRRRVVLPTYPFQRECYWPEAASVQSARATSAPVVDETAEWLYEVAWQGAQQHTAAAGSSAELRPIEGVLRSRGADLAAQSGVAAYAALVEGIDELCCRFILDALRELGWNPVPGRSITVSSLIDELGIVATHGRLVAQLLRILAEDGLLRGSGDEWQVREEVSRPAAGTLAAELRDRFPANEAELELLCRCGEALADVLRGGDALQVLFPDGSLETTEKLYRDSPVARVFNTLVAEGIEAVIGKIHDDRTVRILEIGGGTGGTTSHVLPRLDPDRTEYCFTDVSRLFTARAEEKFAAHPFVRYELLDIERDPAEQGIPEGGFDIVLAANVLHATRDLRATLQRVKRTLAPGGLLVLLEGISPQRFSDLTVGLTEGWWAYEDTDLRPTYALIDRSRWQELLAEEGFHDVVMAPGEREAGEAWGQQVVILSRAPHDQRGAVAEEGVARSWLVLADRGGIGGELTAMLRARGDSAVVARAGASFADHGEGRYTVDAADRRDFERLFGEAIDGELDGMVYLWALDVPPAEADAEAGAVASQEVACSGALHLIQAAAAATGHGSPRLWLVTRGAQPADDGSRRVAVEQSPLLGMGKVIALEHPELRCQRVDLDPAADSDAVALLSELDARTDDDQVALRDGVRKVARLVHIDAEHLDPPATAEIFRDDATYLITGAFGGLGLPLAEWMRASGARHLVLTGRREPGDDAARAIAALRQRGVKLLVARADVSRRADLQCVLEQIDDAMPPLRGVFHLAGALDDGVLLQQSWERFAKVMASKVEGSWNLHRMTRDAQLDYFVLFSSGASLIGSPGQGNHAAANAYLDALAFDRRAQGLPGLSVAWGAWADIGAAVQHQLSASTAFRLMAPAAALRCLGRLLQSDRVLVGVADVNWNELARRSLSSIPFLRVVMDSRAPAQKGAGQAPRASLRDELQAAIPARRRDLLQDRIAREAAQVLGIDPARPIDPERPLQELGLDSLMAVELRNALGQAVEHELPATLLFDHPTLASLFDFVATGVLDGLQAEAEDDESEEDPLTEDELEALLASKLASLQGESGR
jgi:NAD(P)-dependent dehydrogenase (short-subunit alcohol dehydrogenase family)/SAM-dependent methyltransferase/acyl carrier protein